MNRFNLQMILKNEYDDFINKAHLSFNQIKVFNHILRCHTEDMGFNSYHCEYCDFKIIHYNSCRDRNCNMCQEVQREEWIEKYEEQLLPVPYFHIVFTLPDILNPLIYQNQKELYSLMFKAASEALIKATEKNYGKVGFTFILHTWGQNLSYHPHIHCIIAGGGLTTDKQGNQIFKKAPSNYLAPIKVLSQLFKG